MTVMPIDRPTRVRLWLKFADGRKMALEFDGMPGQVLTSMSLEVNAETVVTVPFSTHGVAEHTICRLNGEGVDHVRW